MRKFLHEFKEFAFKGNVMSLAVGVIIGVAFQGVVTSLTDNILSPIIGLFVGQNLDSLTLNMLGVTLYYGAFITSIINFVILAFVVFLIVSSMNKLLAAKENKEEELETLCQFCKTPINPDASRCPACTSVLNAAE